MPVSLPNFCILVQHYFVTVLPTLWPDGSQEEMELVKLFFRWPSIPFAAHAPMTVIVDHAQDIANTVIHAVGAGTQLVTSPSGTVDADIEVQARLTQLSGDEKVACSGARSQRCSRASSTLRSAADVEGLTEQFWAAGRSSERSRGSFFANAGAACLS